MIIVTLLLFALRPADDLPPKQRTTAQVVVTATHSPASPSDSATSVAIVSGEQLRSSGAATTDDALRQVAGFTLFRRAGSRTANPTSQGVSLRGTGASGASRALVLDDGVPLNDPFGGWVYWGRVPRQTVERVEVVRGGASDLYGSGAMGGVIQFLRHEPTKDEVSFDASMGSERTVSGSAAASLVRAEWSATLATDLFTTAGAVLTDPALRGAVDRAAGSRHDTIDATVRHQGERGEQFLRGSRYAERRMNGTAIQTNATTIDAVAAGIDSRMGATSLLLRGHHSSQHYHQLFSAIALDRSTERLTVDQRVPSHASGASAQWLGSLANVHTIVIGAERREVTGASNEQLFRADGRSSAQRVSGRQRTDAVYLEDVTNGRRLSVTAGVRFDAWRNFDAWRDTTPMPSRREHSVSPRVTAMFRLLPRLALTASASRAFRGPTLNELYRSFRVGNVQTEANESLRAEHSRDLEAGLRAGSFRLTAFSVTTSDTISNVTVASTPALIMRQRRNAGDSRSRGVELDGEKSSGCWRLASGVLLAETRVLSGELSGRSIPQVPGAQVTAQLSCAVSGLLTSVQTRWSAPQFDDDRNQYRLRGFFVADLFSSFPIYRRAMVTIAIENLLDRRIETAVTPVRLFAGPRTLRAGIRYTTR